MEYRYPLDNWKEKKDGYNFGDKTFYNDFHIGKDKITGIENLYAPIGGVISNLANGKQGGMTIWLHANDGHIIRFLHLSKFLVDLGDIVEPGQVLGKTGSTGLSTGNHLHTDVWFPKIDTSLPFTEMRKLLRNPDEYLDQLVQQNMDLTQYENQFIRKGSNVEYGFVIRGKKYVWPNEEPIEALILALEKQKKIEIKKIDPVVWDQIPNSKGLQF